MDARAIFNQTIQESIISNRKFLYKRGSYLLPFAKLSKQLSNKEQVRNSLYETEELTVPPVLIISITNDCNLSCKGCYACSQNRNSADEMTTAQIDRIIGEGKELGIGIVLIAGGEPLVKKGILEVVSKHKDVLFVMFTNGLLIDEKARKYIKKTKNLVAAFSLEGDETVTDERRGKGVYKRVTDAMNNMDEENILFGSSITLTSENFDMVMNDEFLNELEEKGNRVLFLIEYVPCNGDSELCLTEEQKEALIEKTSRALDEYNMLMVPLPGDEEQYGGCLAAGRGFLHISSTGTVEACPFAPISDINVKETSLKTALKSELLQKIRENHHLLTEVKGGCALYENKEFVKSLL